MSQDRSEEGIIPSYVSAPLKELDEKRINEKWEEILQFGGYQFLSGSLLPVRN